MKNVPLPYIFEPWTLSKADQIKLGLKIGNENEPELADVNFQKYYPLPIVNEKETAKFAKESLSAVLKQSKTQAEARQVYLKHGSRSNR